MAMCARHFYKGFLNLFNDKVLKGHQDINKYKQMRVSGKREANLSCS
jgi:hypothetical protein